VDGLIPELQSILVLGKPHSGKSWFTEQLAVCVASGIKFLNEFEVKQRSVVIYDEDTPSNTFKRRIDRLARGIGRNISDLAIDAHTNEGFLLTNSTNRNLLISLVKALDNPLVIIDSLVKITGSKDIDKTKEGSSISALWNQIRDTGATVIIVHHMTLKKEARIYDMDVTHLSLGSTQLVAGCDTDISIFSTSTDEFTIKPHGRRDMLRVNHPFAVRLIEDKEQTWAKLIMLEEPPRLPSGDAKSIFLLFNDTSSLTVEKISKRTQKGLSEIDIRLALKELVEEKVIVSDNEAHNRFIYQLNLDFNSTNALTTQYWDALRDK